MDLLNSATTAVFDWALRPLEALGPELALVLASGVFGVLALIVFKHISWQKGIKATKDRIKGHLIEIRLYQDDLFVVGRAVVRIVFFNFRYLGLNFGPFLPLAAPFVLVAAQLVVRYAFAPLPVVEAPGAGFLAGSAVTLEVAMVSGREAEIGGLAVRYPIALRPVSPLVRSRTDGRAFQELVALAPGEHELVLELAGGVRVTKAVAAGDAAPRVMQPERVASFWSAWLWPAEDTLDETSGLARVALAYPERELRWLPDGPFGVLSTLVLASMAFGFALLKPLGIEI